ncbi:HdeD family acid-resistance protein [Pseudonocardia acidicola]|uniref:HdeD family acid-resistance protein n=1 Tax=Pseudonocardia acidicola TaxID=2724939 RepID=A0ABX1S8N2_9PSEU|nr:HdeD family acid-resistance protein [Pseudonocardia acidicola]NMH97916.1 HdeD family acid-resistance protein [Pseudonocardia acidicola]
MNSPTGSARSDRVADTAVRVGGSRGWAIALGVLTIVAGLLVLLWPGPTAAVLAIIIGLELLVIGVFRIVAAFAIDDASGGARTLVVLLGVLAILAGILVLRHPFQTIVVVGLLIGLYWVISGIVDIVRAIGHKVPSRGWTAVLGAFSLLAGIIVLAFPLASVVALTWVLGVLLFASGVLITVAAIMGGQSVPSGQPAPRAAHP